MVNKSEYIEIGTLTKTHGIKGDFKIRINEEIEINKSLVDKKIFIFIDEHKFLIYNVSKFSSSNSNYTIHLKGIENIDAAIALKNSIVYLSLKDKNLITNKLSFIGFAAIINDKIVDNISDIIHNGVYELFVFKFNDKKIIVPNVDDYVSKIDLESNKIIFKNIERLI